LGFFCSQNGCLDQVFWGGYEAMRSDFVPCVPPGVDAFLSRGSPWVVVRSLSCKNLVRTCASEGSSFKGFSCLCGYLWIKCAVGCLPSHSLQVHRCWELSTHGWGGLQDFEMLRALIFLLWGSGHETLWKDGETMARFGLLGEASRRHFRHAELQSQESHSLKIKCEYSRKKKKLVKYWMYCFGGSYLKLGGWDSFGHV